MLNIVVILKSITVSKIFSLTKILILQAHKFILKVTDILGNFSSNKEYRLLVVRFELLKKFIK